VTTVEHPTKVPEILGGALELSRLLEDAYAEVADRHQRMADVRETCLLFSEWVRDDRRELEHLAGEYGESMSDEPAKLRAALFGGTRAGGLGLLKDFSDLQVLAHRLQGAWTLLDQAARAMHDSHFDETCRGGGARVQRQLQWLETRLKQQAPQALTVPPDRLSELEMSLPKRPSAMTMPLFAWAPLVSALSIAVLGGAALISGQPWIVPSLGPSIYLAGESPAHPSARFLNTVIGHLIAIIVAVLTVRALGAQDAPPVLLTGIVTGTRVWAALIALTLTALITVLVRRPHPPAAATALLFALGALEPTRNAMIAVGIGVLIVAGTNEVLRQVRLRGSVTRLARP
jgi:hypothetical protein